MLHLDLAGEPQVVGSTVEAGQRDGVAEDVLDPAQVAGLGLDLKTGVDQPLVVTFSRPHHDPVLVEADRMAIAVARDMRDGEYRHGKRKAGVRDALLGPDDPPVVTVFNPRGPSPFLLLGDHAGRAIPAALGDLGLSEPDRRRHIAWDIGVQALGECLSTALGATFLAQCFSRLVIDCNRDPDATDAVPAVSDHSAIPGNISLTAGQRAGRVEEIHEAYHRQIAQVIAQRAKHHQPTVIVSLHSFSPVMDGYSRPWDAGVLHDAGDTTFALAMLAALRAVPELAIGDNEPYRMDSALITPCPGTPIQPDCPMSSSRSDKIS